MSDAEFIEIVREYRRAVRMYDETLIYGWLQKARALGKKIDAELESQVDIKRLSDAVLNVDISWKLLASEAEDPEALRREGEMLLGKLYGHIRKYVNKTH